MKLSNLMSTDIDTKTFNELPPLHKDVVSSFFKVLEKEDGNVIDRLETAVDKTAMLHNVNTNVLYNYIDKEVEAQLGV